MSLSQKLMQEIHRLYLFVQDSVQTVADCEFQPVLLGDFMKNSVTTADIGKGMDLKTTAVPNKELVQVNEAIRNHPIEEVGKKLRAYMTSMKALV